MKKIMPFLGLIVICFSSYSSSIMFLQNNGIDWIEFFPKYSNIFYFIASAIIIFNFFRKKDNWKVSYSFMIFKIHGIAMYIILAMLTITAILDFIKIDSDLNYYIKLVAAYISLNVLGVFIATFIIDKTIQINKIKQSPQSKR